MPRQTHGSADARAFSISAAPHVIAKAACVDDWNTITALAASGGEGRISQGAGDVMGAHD